MKKKSLANATYEELCRMKRDNFSYGNYWLSCDSNGVTIAHQLGEEVEAATLSRRAFNHLIRKYLQEQEVKGAAEAKK